MEESQKKNEEAAGQDLVETVVELTGLPQEMVDDEFYEMMRESGFDKESMTLDQLRTVLLQYLESMNAEVMASQHASDADPLPH